MVHIMKKYLFLLMISFIFALFSKTVTASEWTGNVNLLLGVKMLNENDWEPVNEQGELSIHVDLRSRDWPISIEMGLSGSYDTQEDYIGIEDFNRDGSTGEFKFGVRKTWEPDESFRPYLGGGLAVITVKEELRFPQVSYNDEDTCLGLWIHGGLYWTLSNAFNIGFDLGFTGGKASLIDIDLQTADNKIFTEKDIAAGGGHFAFFVGYHW
ncbi:MAG: hypothetical protein KJ737_25635 [Proteobacteria bacterium]|nr:hypothetical protein [Pseudomonadota bacterium]